MFKIGDMIDCVITEIDKDKRRIAISVNNENPYDAFMNKYPEGSIIEGVITNQNEYALYVKLGEYDIDGFLQRPFVYK